jgi:hypothetical protein
MSKALAVGQSMKLNSMCNDELNSYHTSNLITILSVLDLSLSCRSVLTPFCTLTLTVFIMPPFPEALLSSSPSLLTQTYSPLSAGPPSSPQTPPHPYSSTQKPPS